MKALVGLKLWVETIMIKVYEIGLEYFTQYDESGKVTKAGKTFEAKETPETVGVLVQKTDSESGNVVKGAGFAVFKDAACTQRVLMNGDTGAEVPVFYYDEDLDGAASEKFVKQQDDYYGIYNAEHEITKILAIKK